MFAQTTFYSIFERSLKKLEILTLLCGSERPLVFLLPLGVKPFFLLYLVGFLRSRSPFKLPTKGA